MQGEICHECLGTIEGETEREIDMGEQGVVAVHVECDFTRPPPGSWADVARMMASTDDGSSGIDWDAWKDEMKERGLDEG
jgi:hypothetical protein